MKQIVLVIIVSFLYPKTFFAQKPVQECIDSLFAEILKAKDDTNKVKLLTELSYAYHTVNPSEGIKYGQQAISLSKNLEWKTGLSEANRVIGLNYFIKSDYATALEYNLNALKYASELNYKMGMAEILSQIGLVYQEQSSYLLALEYDARALKIAEEIDNKNVIANVMWSYANFYGEQNDNTKAFEFLNKALKLYREQNNTEGEAIVLNDIGVFNSGYGDTSLVKALMYLNNAVIINEKFGYKHWLAINIANIGNVFSLKRDFLKALEYAFKSVKIDEGIGSKRNLTLATGNIGEAYLFISKETNREKLPDTLKNRTVTLRYAFSYLSNAIELSKEIDYINASFWFTQDLAEVQTLSHNYIDAIASYKQSGLYRDALFSQENKKKMESLSFKYETELKQKEISIQKLELKRAENEKYGLYGGLGFMGIIAFVSFRNLRRKKRDNKVINELLFNILPVETAEELKATGTAKARSYDEVTVMFTDFKNFTQASERMSAEELVNEINYCYSGFDGIIQKHGIEKIKTIGDSYMCAGGLPVENKSNPVDVVAAALEISNFMQKRKTENPGKEIFEIRIGIHTGPVVAGIVGVKKFAYDIWGDTVNFASRMENSSEVGKINISGITYEMVKNKFNCTYRGKIEVKNKGIIDMYFVDKRISEG